jgi:excisionase family DNA binding protein
MDLEKRMQTVEPWLSVEEISSHLGVSKETIYRWLEREAIPAHRIGKLWKFKATEVDQWVMNGGASDKDALSRKSKTNTTSKD